MRTAQIGPDLRLGFRVKIANFLTTPLSRNSQKRLEHKENQTKYRKMTRKSRSSSRILICRTWAIAYVVSIFYRRKGKYVKPENNEEVWTLDGGLESSQKKMKQWRIVVIVSGLIILLLIANFRYVLQIYFHLKLK